MQSWLSVWSTLGTLGAWLLWAPAAPALAAAQEDELLARLQRGGLILAFAAAEAPQPRLPGADVDCRPPAALSPEGQRDAKAMGDGFRNRELRFDGVFASPWCSARHTAYLAIGADWVRYREALGPHCGEPGVAPQLQAWLGILPASDRNHLAFTHACSLQLTLDAQGVACPRPLSDGDAVVFDPARAGTALGCIGIERWRAWAAEAHFSERLEPRRGALRRRP